MLTNNLRKCFGLPPVEPGWERIKLPRSKYDDYDTYIYIDGVKIKKLITVSESRYFEGGMDETLTPDRQEIMPKTDRGKRVKLTAATVVKKPLQGMALCYADGDAALHNFTTQQSYYSTCYEDITLNSLDSFARWVEEWCAGTTPDNLREIEAFASRERVHQKYREGDFFRFKLNRRLYGYGRLIISYAEMRKKHIPFWDIFMGKPLLVGIYHIATEDKDLPPERLEGLGMLPPELIMDNPLFYGECEIIGNAPLSPEDFDCPVHYGRSLDVRDRETVNYQCGKFFMSVKAYELPGDGIPKRGYAYNGVCTGLDVSLPVLLECIRQGSNAPYWASCSSYTCECDLRSPENSQRLKEIREQLGII